MRGVFAIVVALTLAAIVLSPAMGYSVSIGNHSYSLKSARVNYSINTGMPSHAPAVVVTRVPNSLKYAGTGPYTTNSNNVVKPVSEGSQVPPGTVSLGGSTGSIISPAAPANITSPANMTSPAPVNVSMPPAPAAEKQNLSIQGTVYDDRNVNGKMDDNETGIANWTVNLEQPSGKVVSSAATSENGGYGFYTLAPGEYSVVEVLKTGWAPTMPSNGRNTINITDNTTDLNFGNEMLPAPENTTAPTNLTASANVTLPENVTLQK